MLVDLLHLSRNLRRSPASAVAAVLTLSLTLGAGASIFAVVDAVLLTPPPFANPNALVTVNGQRFEENVLHNGDTLGIGSVQIQFWLSETRQRGLRLREWLTWTAIAIISLGQIAAIYYLLHQASL